MTKSSEALDDITAYITSCADRVDESLASPRTGNLADCLRYYAAYKTAYEALDTARKRIYEQVEGLSRRTIPEMMAEQDIKTITLDDIGYRFTVQQRFNCTMPDKEKGMLWLQSNGLGNLIQETVNSSSLTAAAKKRIEDDGLDMPTELFNTSYMAVTSMTKAK